MPIGDEGKGEVSREAGGLIAGLRERMTSLLDTHCCIL